MPHFWVDDGWHKHRKRIMVGLDLDGFAARGLWLDAGSWCCDELTDGWVPAYMLDYLAPGIGRDLAKRLERGRLWEPEIRDGEEGWQFHDWTEFQLMRDEVLAQRQRKADSGVLGNHRRWHTARGKVDPTCRYCATDRTTDRSSESPRYRGDVGATEQAATVTPVTTATDRTTDRTTDRSCDQNGAQGANVRRTTDRYPDRTTESPPIPPVPVPQPIEEQSQNLLPRTPCAAGAEDTIPGTDIEPAAPPSVKKPARGSRLPDGWMPSADARSWAAAEYPGVDLRTEHMKFTNYWLGKSGRDATKVSWDRTWRNWIITAAERIGPRAKQAAALGDGRAVHTRTGEHLDHLSRYGDLDA